MSIQILKEHIKEHGVGNAIVVLNTEKLSHDENDRLITGLPEVNAALAARAPMLRHTPMRYFHHLGIAYGTLSQEGLRVLENHDAVDRISHAPPMNLIRPYSQGKHITQSPAEIAWGVQRMQAAELWHEGFTGKGIVVAHLDTGADSQHPALQGAIGHHMVFDKNGREINTPGPCTDSHEHGTHTSGVIAARPTTSGSIIGMAPDAILACGTVVVEEDVVARVIAGMDWAISIGARVLSLSVGVFGENDAFDLPLQRLRAKGVLPVVAIGNSEANTSWSPGNCSAALSVGATCDKNLVAKMSCSQQFVGDRSVPSLCAPGVDILSAVPGGTYVTTSGTSEAAPHIAGLAALLLQAKPDASIDEVQKAILASCENPAGVDRVRIGAGIPNGLGALGHLV